MNKTLQAWTRVGQDLRQLLEHPETSPHAESWESASALAFRKNGWFTRDQLQTALKGLVKLLDEQDLQQFARAIQPAKQPKKVGVIMAGNIPMAGFHDLLCVNLSGHIFEGKPASDDPVLLPFITELLHRHDAEAASRISYSGAIKGADAVIATGSNNSSRYFDYYFGKLPHIFRKNRNSAAVLTGDENEYDLILLGQDIFTYFGLGCRSISKLFVPEGYDFDLFFNAMQEFAGIMEHNKYMNNYDYNRSVYLLNQMPFLTNNFMIVMEQEALASPVAVVHYETYRSADELAGKLDSHRDALQVVSGKHQGTPLGRAQLPGVEDFADGIDTRTFLNGL